MKQHDRICHRIAIKSEKQRELYRKREEKGMEGTPKIILGKAEASSQEIWTDDLKSEPIARLKEANTSERGLGYARTIVHACLSLAQHYGFFIINENMIFSTPGKEVVTWINPDVRENHVKIYLPHTHEGELAMIRSILTYFKLWLKADYSQLADLKSLSELVFKVDSLKFKPTEGFKGKSPERGFLVNRRNSINADQPGLPQRQDEAQMHLLMENKSMKDMMGRSPGKESESAPNFLTSSLSNKLSSPLKFPQLNSLNEKEQFKNKTTLVSEKNAQEEFEHRTMTGVNGGMMVAPLNKSVGVKGGNTYYPNKTTSNKGKHHIVSMINQQDCTPHEYGRNKILLDERNMTEQEMMERGKKGKETLDGIGEELNDLFVSTIENEEENEQANRHIEEEFSSIME